MTFLFFVSNREDKKNKAVFHLNELKIFDKEKITNRRVYSDASGDRKHREEKKNLTAL